MACTVRGRCTGCCRVHTGYCPRACIIYYYYTHRVLPSYLYYILSKYTSVRVESGVFYYTSVSIVLPHESCVYEKSGVRSTHYNNLLLAEEEKFPRVPSHSLLDRCTKMKKMKKKKPPHPLKILSGSASVHGSNSVEFRHLPLADMFRGFLEGGGQGGGCLAV